MYDAEGQAGMVDWRDIHVGFEGDGLMIGGIEIWRQDWRRTENASLDLPHPAYPGQRHRFGIYEVGGKDNPVRFAAGELSGGVWGFYIPVEGEGAAARGEQE